MTIGGANEYSVLIAPSCGLGQQLETAGLRVLSWPSLQIQPPKTFAPLDEAIENLFGYDWIMFVSPEGVRFFLQRLTHLGHEVSVLDALRVGAISEETAMVFDHAAVHIDVVANRTDPAAVINQLANYAGADSLDRLNLLLPQAAIGRDYLKPHLEGRGARADVAVAYQTVASEDLTRLTGLQSMLLTGSIDAVAFSSADEVGELARVFDTASLSTLLEKAWVLTADESTTKAASLLNIPKPVEMRESSAPVIAALLSERLGR